MSNTQTAPSSFSALSLRPRDSLLAWDGGEGLSPVCLTPHSSLLLPRARVVSSAPAWMKAPGAGPPVPGLSRCPQLRSELNWMSAARWPQSQSPLPSDHRTKELNLRLGAP